MSWPGAHEPAVTERSRETTQGLAARLQEQQPACRRRPRALPRRGLSARNEQGGVHPNLEALQHTVDTRGLPTRQSTQTDPWKTEGSEYPKSRDCKDCRSGQGTRPRSPRDARATGQPRAEQTLRTHRTPLQAPLFWNGKQRAPSEPGHRGRHLGRAPALMQSLRETPGLNHHH